jgi:hypothetical protein
MKTITLNIYSFDELSQEAKEVAIDSLCSINVEHDWWDCTYEDARQIGLKISSFDLDRNRHAKGIFILAANEVAQNIFNSHGIDCETYKTASNFMGEWQPIFNNYMDENHEEYESREVEETMQELENDFLNSLLEDYSIILQRECDYLQSKEAIIETIKANEYEFLESGKKY